MSHIRSICVTKKSSVIEPSPSSTGWPWVRSCIFLGLPKSRFPTGWEVFTDRKGVSGTWREWCHGFSRASWDWLCKVEQRAIEPPGRGSALGEGYSWLGVGFTRFVSAVSKDSHPLTLTCQSPFKTRKETQSKLISCHTRNCFKNTQRFV